MMVMSEEKVRKLTHALVSCAISIQNNRQYFEGKTDNEVGEWISLQLNECGFPNGPSGMAHVSLNNSLFK
jgi:hypothetical protein